MSFVLAFLSGTLGKLLDLAKRVPWYVWVGALVLLIGWRVHAGLEKRALADAFNGGFNRAYVVQEARIKIQNKSIADLRAIIDAKNAESDKRAADYAASRAQDAQDVAAANERAKATASRIATLQGIAAHASANPTCKAPDALVSALEGL